MDELGCVIGLFFKQWPFFLFTHFGFNLIYIFLHHILFLWIYSDNGDDRSWLSVGHRQRRLRFLGDGLHRYWFDGSLPAPSPSSTTTPSTTAAAAVRIFFESVWIGVANGPATGDRKATFRSARRRGQQRRRGSRSFTRYITLLFKKLQRKGMWVEN